MKIRDFDYDLPSELIAQYPLNDRAGSRLLVLDRAKDEIQHRHFSDIAEFFNPGDVLVLNNTRVFKARLRGKKETGGNIEVLLVQEQEKDVWIALVHSSRRLKIATKIIFYPGVYARVRDKSPGMCLLEFNIPVDQVIEKIGVVPLPHYIKRDAEPVDESAYQTVYAEKRGSVAAPTAGLHFTSEVLGAIEARGGKIARLVLHIGPGTFKPIRTDDIENHVMDTEYFEIPGDVMELINCGQRIIGVGTSVTRALEFVAAQSDEPSAKSFSGRTDLFIYPGHKFKVIDRLVTNFHLPCSTPMLLVCAFAGKDLIMRAYGEAIDKKYRFLSYGDAMLII